jgi:ribonuclease R
VGTIHIARRGYGFVDTPEGEYFVLHGHLHGAMDGDVVEVVRLRALEQRRRDIRVQDWKLPRGARGRERERLGSVRRVLERAHTTLIGTLVEHDGLRVVRPHDERIDYDVFLDRRAISTPASNGDVVIVRITTYPSRLEAACGYIEEVIGREGESACDIEIIIRKHGFETAFSPAAEAQSAEAVRRAGDLADGVADVPSDDLAGSVTDAPSDGPAGSVTDAPSDGPADGVADDGLADGVADDGLRRRDLRDRLIFTIDPADAKDFDDALSLDELDGQMRLGVHIADVSAFVPPDGALDLAARSRATSVYLPDRVIPMLPPALSDDLCSLRPELDRLAFTVDMVLGDEGSVISCEFYPSRIRSACRLSYDQVQQILEGAPTDAAPTDGAPTDGAPTPALATAAPEPIDGASASVPAPDATLATTLTGELTDRLHALNRLAHTLAHRRRQRGAIDFASVEAKVTLDDEGRPVAVRLRGRTDATALVEEAMILANEQVAAFMLARQAPMLYRIHEAPLPAALEELLSTLQEFGYATTGAPRTSAEVQRILEESAEAPEHTLISQLLLRAMKRARYSPYWVEHFGLASSAYTHFTSPIRRYPDLMVHRLLKRELSTPPGRASSLQPTSQPQPAPAPASPAPAPTSQTQPTSQPSPAQLGAIAEHASEQERRAEAAAREATAMKLAEYLSTRIGEQFSALIVGVNSYGLYVREETTTAEGFIAARTLPEGLRFEPERHRWRDSETECAYRLGQTLPVVLCDVERPSMRLRFVIA